MPKMLERETTPLALCDGCGAPASEIVVTADLGVFDFCGHCFRRHEKALKPLLLEVENAG